MRKRARPPGKRSAQGRCPSCLEPCDVYAQEHLRCAEESLVEHHPREYGSGFEGAFRQLAAEGNERWFWACDGCIDAGHAIASNVLHQNSGAGAPFAAYVDRTFTCSDCNAPSVFGAEEQRLWYEDYSFLIYSHPKQCVDCRRTRRDDKATHQKLAAALAQLDGTDADSLDEIAELYGALGSDKATEFRRRAANVRRISAT